MSEKVKTFNQLLAATPFVQDSKDNVFMVDSYGNPSACSSKSFVRVDKISVEAGAVLKIANFDSIIVSSRGCHGGRCCFLWISSYDPGTQARTNSVILYSDSLFKWYVNGESEFIDAIYMKNTQEEESDTFYVSSLSGKAPSLSIVSAVPSDATVLRNDLSISPGG